jgi:chromate transport protein ChrA
LGIGSVIFGGGFVMVPEIEAEVVFESLLLSR